MGKRFSMLIFLFLLVGYFSLTSAQIHISGSLSGTLVDTTYIVDGNISVEDSASLIIEAGANILFDGPYEFVIRGLLRAEGTEQDSITFVPCPAGVFWNGIDFVDSSSDSCLLRYCLIQESKDNGIDISNCSPTIDHCTVHLNSAMGTNHAAGGILIRGIGRPKISNCTITENEGWWGGGINIGSSRAVISYCIIARNQGFFGGGINVDYGNAEVVIDHCLITGNDAGEGGGIRIFSYGARVAIVNCTITDNSGMEIIGGIGGIQVLSCLSTRIVNVIVANNQGGGIGGTYNIEHSCFYQNQGGNFPHSPNDSLGLIVTTNANGDSCDIYQNIFLDPMFVDTTIGDFHLMAGSPCIDAGDPESPWDPDSTIADMGAFYYDQASWVFPKDRLALPTEFRLLQNYPNPFNNTTIIGYQLPIGEYVTLEIYNLLGQKITTLVNSYQHPGYQSVIWDATTCASGIYIVRLMAGDREFNQKVVLLR